MIALRIISILLLIAGGALLGYLTANRNEDEDFPDVWDLSDGQKNLVKESGSKVIRVSLENPIGVVVEYQDLDNGKWVDISDYDKW